ncbi:undecaprenyl-phosphate 4-deoxy-4-formamido-L-arabinose transferase [Pseudobutyrivibrio sp. JW11]|uniref:glycosyltransferase family 2 protein n=1 Tax=Pseudobutyrivibrio TaxID=46205 RepID=UPI0008E560A7|nr:MULTISPECIES: glycosyltransferase family 2 protein [Pseudobutyrivibrio]MBE5912943.1 glycosyltransferase [Pseudobutyrivibrio ruminis]MBE6025210.1 glycosyltransferase [Cellulosilyticum sp.]SFO35396.1 undecaprenyl-phosphate 4-deoxy-4-formamido-L-arabinose transferase [Pseudobutyrivibrio sp. JW11]
MKVSFVIPCYNSAKTIEKVVAEVQSKMDTLSKYTYEIVLVNDCSPDNTFDVIRDLCAKNQNIIGINHSKNFGQHAALMAGFHFISGDIVVCLDDDGQTPADEVDKLLEKIDEGYDVVYAQYEHKQHSGFRNWGSHLNKKMTEIMLNKPKELYISSYFAAKRYVVNEMLNYKGAYPYLIGLVLRCTRNICNVKVNHRERKEGHSGYTFKKLLGLWMNGFTSFSILPLRLATYGGSIIAILGFIYAIYAIISKFMNPDRMLGWSSLISVNLILGGLILITLGLIGEYVGRIFISINNSPQYVIKNVINYNEDKA